MYLRQATVESAMKKQVLKRAGGEHGLTFVELAVVLALVGIVAAIAVPQLNKDIGRFRLQVAARELLADLRWAQQSVINREYLEYNIVFDPANERYMIYDRGRAMPPVKVVSMPAGVDLNNTNFPSNILILNLKGLPVAAGTVELADRASGDRLYVIIHPRGRARIDTVRPQDISGY